MFSKSPEPECAGKQQKEEAKYRPSLKKQDISANPPLAVWMRDVHGRGSILTAAELPKNRRRIRYDHRDPKRSDKHESPGETRNTKAGGAKPGFLHPKNAGPNLASCVRDEANGKPRPVRSFPSKRFSFAVPGAYGLQSVTGCQPGSDKGKDHYEQEPGHEGGKGVGQWFDHDAFPVPPELIAEFLLRIDGHTGPREGRIARIGQRFIWTCKPAFGVL